MRDKKTTGRKRYGSGAGSVAAIAGHPLHPLVVPLVIGLYTAAVIADVAFVRSGDAFFARGAGMLLLGTLMAGALAVLPGLIDLLAIPRARRLPAAWVHGVGNLVFLVLVGWNYAHRQSEPLPVDAQMSFNLSLLGLAVLLVTGWLGGELSFRHGVGVSPEVGTGSTPIPQTQRAKSQ
jgi:uncharacterized membrane protein